MANKLVLACGAKVSRHKSHPYNQYLNVEFDSSKSSILLSTEELYKVAKLLKLQLQSTKKE